MSNKLLIILCGLACWSAIPFDQQVRSRPLIIQATLTTITPATPLAPGQEDDRSRRDRGTLQIENVLKTPDARIVAPGTVVLLMPAADRTFRISTDVTFTVGEHGIWMLLPQADGWIAERPSDLQPLTQADTIKRHISEQAH